MSYKPNEREYRSFSNFQHLEGGETAAQMQLSGTPIVFDTPTVLFEQDGIEYKEQIAKGALDGCDLSDFILNRNHGVNDGTVYARSKNGTLRYTITDAAMLIECDLDPEDERHKNLHRDVKKGLVDKMSFSFIIGECKFDKKTNTRTITKIKKLFDVSAVDFPAYAETNIQVARDYFSAECEKQSIDPEREKRRKILIAKTYL